MIHKKNFVITGYVGFDRIALHILFQAEGFRIAHRPNRYTQALIYGKKHLGASVGLENHVKVIEHNKLNIIS